MVPQYSVSEQADLGPLDLPWICCYCPATNMVSEELSHQTALPALYKIPILATASSDKFLLLNRRGAEDTYGIVLGGNAWETAPLPCPFIMLYW